MGGGHLGGRVLPAFSCSPLTSLLVPLSSSHPPGLHLGSTRRNHWNFMFTPSSLCSFIALRTPHSSQRCSKHLVTRLSFQKHQQQIPRILKGKKKFPPGNSENKQSHVYRLSLRRPVFSWREPHLVQAWPHLFWSHTHELILISALTIPRSDR